MDISLQILNFGINVHLLYGIIGINVHLLYGIQQCMYVYIYVYNCLPNKKEKEDDTS